MVADGGAGSARKWDGCPRGGRRVGGVVGCRNEDTSGGQRNGERSEKRIVNDRVEVLAEGGVGYAKSPRTLAECLELAAIDRLVN